MKYTYSHRDIERRKISLWHTVGWRKNWYGIILWYFMWQYSINLTTHSIDIWNNMSKPKAIFQYVRWNRCLHSSVFWVFFNCRMQYIAIPGIFHSCILTLMLKSYYISGVSDDFRHQRAEERYFKKCIWRSAAVHNVDREQNFFFCKNKLDNSKFKSGLFWLNPFICRSWLANFGICKWKGFLSDWRNYPEKS